MAKSKITITFDSIPQVGDQLILGNSLSSTDIDETFVALRIAFFQSTIGPDVDLSALYYRNAVGVDYNGTNLYLITFNLNVVTIEATQSNTVFSVVTNNTGGRVLVSIDNQSETEAITIDDISYTEADSDPCNNVKINVTTSRLATIINKGSGNEANGSNPFDYDSVRGINKSLYVEDSDSNSDSTSFTLPDYLSVSNTVINIINSPDGATITVLITNVDGLVLEYSLDGITWQDSNVFGGQTVGAGTMYVRDQLGCSFTKAYEVLDFQAGDVGVNVPNAPLPSKENSLRFKELVVWGDCGVYKTDENTLSCEADVPLPEKTIQRFQTCDTAIETQIKSNYDTIVVKVIKVDDTEDIIPLIKKSSLLNQNDKRDANVYDLGLGKTGIYFKSGNTYDYTTGLDNGDYALNGKLPYWGQLGGWIEIDSAWYVIENIIYDKSKKADVLVITNPFTDPETVKIVASVYNKENFEYYEFDIDMSQYLDIDFFVEIKHTHTNFPDVTFLSEQINVKVRQTGTLEMRYWNLQATEILYSTGIQHLIRMPLVKSGSAKVDESDLNRGDVRTILIDSKLYELKEFEFEPMASEMMVKTVIALSCEVVKLDGASYVKNEEIGLEGPLGDTNTYVIKSIQAKDGTLFELAPSGSLSETLELPGIISGGENVVGY